MNKIISILILIVLSLLSASIHADYHTEDELKSELMDLRYALNRDELTELEAFQKGARLNAIIESNPFIRLDLRVLYSNQDLFLKYVNLNNFLKLILFFDQTTIRENGKYRFDEALGAQQVELIKLAIEKGANINDVIEADRGSMYPIRIEGLYANKDLFLEHVSPNNFLKLVLSDKYIGLDYPNHDEFAVGQQTELIELAIEEGAKLSQVIDSVWRVNSCVVYFNKDIFLKELRANKLLDVIIVQLNNEHNAIEFKKQQLELAHFAIDQGADVKNIRIDLESLLFSKPELLKFLVANGVKCDDETFDEITEGGLAHIAINPQLVLDQKYKNLNAKECIEPKMPYIIHHIWLTHPSSPKEIREEDIVRAIETKEIFAKGKAQWQHIVWTNNRDLIPQSVVKLEESGIQVKSIKLSQYKRLANDF